MVTKISVFLIAMKILLIATSLGAGCVLMYCLMLQSMLRKYMLRQEATQPFYWRLKLESQVGTTTEPSMESLLPKYFHVQLRENLTSVHHPVVSSPAVSETLESLHSNNTEIRGSKCFIDSHRNSSLLSVHMVIAPFLQYTQASEDLIQERLKEYRYVLEKNLAHPLVQCVHVLTTNSTQTLQMFIGVANREKLMISEVKRLELARDPWEYISTNLLNKDMVYANADIYLGNGFQLVDPKVMSENRLAYALTRHVAPEERCNNTEEHKKYTYDNLCLSIGYYIGSHDVFLLRLHNPLPPGFLSELNFELASPGIENVVIWLLQTKLKYCVLNPCRTLQTFHYHCSFLRNSKHRRVNHHTNTGRAPFTENLVC